ncbi:MAG: HEAT repeat domain-containing protein [Candidatus Hydrogenedentes bacterium]|nr:HEAT repeat domain-containing protein [Candidatus Hydrogenedentota bacterium]
MNASIILDSDFCVRLVLTLIHSLWEGVILAVVAGLVVRVFLRHGTAQSRYVVYLVALGLMVLAPAATFLYLEPGSETVGIAEPALSPVTVPEPASDPISRVENPASGTKRPAASLPHRTGEALSNKVPLAAWLNSVHNFDWRLYSPYVAMAYAGGVLLMLVRLAFALGGGKRLRRRSEPVDDATVLEALARQAKVIGLRFTPALAYCRQVLVPTVVGVLRPMILLPLSFANGLTPAQIELLLLHELAHIRRYDLLVNVLQRVAEALLFYHPAVWYVSRRIRLEREHCCDDLVLAYGGEAQAYAESLVHVASLAHGAASSAVLTATGKPSQLRERVLRMVGRSDPMPVRLNRGGLVLALMSLVVLISVSYLYAQTAANEQTEEQSQSIAATTEPIPPKPTAEPRPKPSLAPQIQYVPPETAADMKARNILAVVQEPSQVEASDAEGAPHGPTVTRPLPSDQNAKVTLPSPVPSNVAELFVQLEDPDWWLRKVAVQQIGEIGEERFKQAGAAKAGPGKDPLLSRLVPKMIKMLKDEDQRVQAAAAEALGKLGDPSAAKHLVAALKTQMTKEGEVQADVGGAAAEALIKLGSDASLGMLRFALKDPDSSMKARAVRALMGLGTPECVALLVDEVRQNGGDFGERTGPDCLDALKELGPERTVDPLLMALRSDTAEEVANVVRALGLVGGDRAFEAILELPEDAPLPVRRMTMSALVNFKDERATQVLARGLRDPDFNTRMNAAGILSRKAWLPANEQEQVLFRVALADWKTIPALGAEAVEPLIVALGSEAPEYRREAARCLGEIGDKRATQPLAKLLEDNESSVRHAAVQALAKLADPEGMPPLIAALRDTESDVRVAAADALGTLADPRAVEPLMETLRDPDEKVRGSAIKALGALGDRRAAPALIESIREPNHDLRVEAVSALGKLKDPSATAPLIALLEDPDGGVREAAVTALGNIGDPQAVTPLINLLGRENVDMELRWSIVGSLGALRDPAAVPAIAEVLVKEPQPGSRPYGNRARLLTYCVQSLAKIGGDDAVNVLVQVLIAGESDAALHEAIKALGEMRSPQAIPALTQLAIRGGDTGVWSASALGQIGGREAARALGDVLAVHLQKLGSVANPDSSRMLNAALAALGQIPDAAAADVLAEFLQNPLDTHGFQYVLFPARLLAERGDPRAKEPLEKLKESPETRLQAEEALAILEQKKG